MYQLRITAPFVVAGAIASFAPADQIVQDGVLSGFEGPPVEHVVSLDQFDPLGGARQLNFVQLDFLTSEAGGGQTNGSGVAVHIVASLTADYFLAGAPIASTEALIDTVISNNGPPASFSLFDTDTAQVTYDEAAPLAPWIGSGTIDLGAVTQFTLSEDPSGIVGFGAGGTVRYTVTYDYDDAALCPNDLDGDGTIGFGDLVQLLSVWGPCAACPEDLDASGTVGFEDLLAVLSAWGPCL